MRIKAFFDGTTQTLTYVVHKQDSRHAIVIDPVLDFDPASGLVEEKAVVHVIDYLRYHNLTPEMSLETHAHADHLSGSQILKKHFPKVKVAISERIVNVQKIFTKILNIKAPTDGSQFDYLFRDNEEAEVAGLKVKEIPTPGHTPACSSYLIENAVFTGDALFMPDYGVGRCDFPGGSARSLYQSISQNLFTLPGDTRVFVGHDYQPGGRAVLFESTVAEQKASNIHLSATTTEAEFIKMREARDKTLNVPRLLYPSIQVNILAGCLPEPEANGRRYFKLPLELPQTR